MGKINNNTVVQLIGMLGIISSLIFVGLEMRQTQKIAIAGQQQARSALGNTVILSMNDIGVDVQSVYFEGKSRTDLSLEQIALRNTSHIAWFLYENDFYQYEQGLMDDETWEAKVVAMKALYNNCSVRTIVMTRKPTFSKPLKDLIETFPDRCAKPNSK